MFKSKKPESVASDKSRPAGADISPEEMQRALLATLGPNGAATLWLFLTELRQGDSADAVQFRMHRAAYLTSTGIARASVILNMLGEWEQNPGTTQNLDDFIIGVRELTTFRFAETICKQLNDKEPQLQEKVREAVALLKQVFAKVPIDIKIPEIAKASRLQ